MPYFVLRNKTTNEQGNAPAFLVVNEDLVSHDCYQILFNKGTLSDFNETIHLKMQCFNNQIQPQMSDFMAWERGRPLVQNLCGSKKFIEVLTSFKLPAYKIFNCEVQGVQYYFLQYEFNYLDYIDYSNSTFMIFDQKTKSEISEFKLTNGAGLKSVSLTDGTGVINPYYDALPKHIFWSEEIPDFIQVLGIRLISSKLKKALEEQGLSNIHISTPNEDRILKSIRIEDGLV